MTEDGIILRGIRAAGGVISLGIAVGITVGMVCGIVVSLTGCDYFGEGMGLDIRLPTPPADWPEGVEIQAWRVFWPDSDGTESSARVTGTRRIVTLRIPKEHGVFVVAEPMVVIGDTPVPVPAAGAVWPVDASGDRSTLRASWEHGFLAELVRILRYEGNAVRTLNLHRLAREISTRSDGNPRALDLQAIAESALARRMRVTLIRPRTSHDVMLDDIAGLDHNLLEGVWTAAAPGAQGLTLARNGPDIRRSVRLVEGVHTYIREDARCLMTIYVNHRGEAEVNIRAVTPLVSIGSRSLPVCPGP
jgi:hypothetical protein